MEKQERSENNLSISSDATSDPRDEDCPTEDSFKLAFDFLDRMSDHVSEKRQSKKIGRQQETQRMNPTTRPIQLIV